ncbi:MAG: class I SAM-dependent methyltransferase [Candidatus Nealsonbacteria bacterium]|nr:class I SAM-dependent methyltransferase [Candidatus Nealsonbacteria bacterium]
MKKPEKNSKWDFDKWAKRYDKTIKRGYQANDWMYKNYEEVLNQVVAFTQDILKKPKITMVDIGVGTGNLAQKFVGKVEHLIGIDSSVEMLKISKEKLPTIEARKGDFLELPVADNSVNLIVSAYAFHHLTEEEKMKALEEMHRILKKQGKIIIADLMFANQKAEKGIKSKLIAENKGEIVTEIEEEHYGYMNTLTQKVIGLGFSVQQKQMTDFVWVICGKR